MDIVHIRSDQTTADAVAASLGVARVADECGYERYWLAEHHNMADIAATSPPVMMALVASATSRIRVGSGAVLLPNHSPLVVAEQFALLEAAFPGRIDMGIGRASGSDPVTSWALRTSTDIATRFDEHLDQLQAMVGPDGATVQAGGRRHVLKGTPNPASVPQLWLLGSSSHSARLAAAKGLPYVFAHHFSGQGTAEALALYRSTFRPSAVLSEPKTFLTVNACVAETDDEARRRSLPQALGLLALFSGGPQHPLPLIEEAEKVELSAAQRSTADAVRANWLLGGAERARAELAELAEVFQVDEIMVNPVAGTYLGTDPTTSPTKEETIRLLAA